MTPDYEAGARAMGNVWDWLVSQMMDPHSSAYIDWDDFEEFALKEGLIEETRYDPEKHGPDFVEVEPGDPFFVLTDKGRSLARLALPLPEAEATTGRHWDSCAFVHATGPCDCGFDAVATDIPNPTSPTADAERAVVEAAMAWNARPADQQAQWALARACDALRAAAPEEPPELGEASMPRVGGKPFRCDCGANVFTRRGMKFTCNGCGTVYEGTPKAAR